MFQGVIPALITPMFDNGEIDFNSLENLVAFHIDQGTDAVLPCGTTGESPTLTHEEHLKVVKTVIDASGGRLPVIAGTGSNSTREASALTVAAEKLGVSGALLITPYYNKPTQEGLFLHFEAIAKQVDIPIIVYNVPGRTGVSLSAETLARLAELPNIVAIKEASGDLERLNKIQALCNIDILSGDDSLTFPMLALGAKGVISVAANLVPEPIGRMIRSFKEGRIDEGREIHRRLYPLMSGLFCETNPIPVKAAMHMVGRAPAGIRPPLTPLAQEHRQALRKKLQDLGLVD